MMFYVAFLRGINVGGNKKISMKELAWLFEEIGFENIKTMLNSGNVIFECKETAPTVLCKKIEKAIEEHFDFEVGVQVRKLEEIQGIVKKNPFKKFRQSEDTHWYVTFLNNFKGKMPAVTSDSFKLLSIQNDALFSIIDRTKGPSTDIMAFLDKTFGKKVTTRNWNTIVKISGVKNYGRYD